MPAIQPKILTWARETAGLSLDDAAVALGTKAERLASLEAGVDEPTRPLLVKMAKTYRRPLLVFYLAEPPKQGDRGHDFRTLPASQAQFNPDLDALVRDIKARQGLIRSMLEDSQGGPVDFVGSVSMDLSAPKLAALIAERLQFSLARLPRDEEPRRVSFGYLREKIEGSGVYILLLGNLGSYHTNIPVDIFRGFAIADKIAPLIVINDLDARAAWSFTALHELAHLWLGTTGISAKDTEQHIEQYCNDVAGEFLLPTAEIRQLAPNVTKGLAAVAAEISAFAEARRVSRAMVAYKLYRTGMISKPLWMGLDQRFRQEWEAHKEREAQKNKLSEGGPNYYIVRRHRMGSALLGLVRRSLDEGTTTYTKASTVLGVKPRSVEPLLQRGTR